MPASPRTPLVALLLFLSGIFAHPAQAQVPNLLGFQGRLLRADGTAATGTATVAFAVFASDTGGAPLWSETQTLGLSDGYYSTFLGLVSLPPQGLFGGPARWLEIRVGSETLAPRQQVGAVPYAVTAQNLAGGAADVESLRVAGQTVIDSAGRLAGNARYGAGAGIVVDDAGQTVSLKPCADGEVLLHDDMTWECAPAAVGSVTQVGAVPPLSVASATSTPEISMPQAASNASGYLSSVDWSAFNAKYGALSQCGGDLAGTLGVPSVVGLQSRPVSPNQPTAGQVLKWASTRWEPAADANAGGTVTTVTGVAPLSVWNGSLTPQISIVQSSGSADGYLAAADFARFEAKYGSSTVCGGDLEGTLAAPVVARLQGVSLATASPASSQVLRFDGSRWAPASLIISDVGGLSSGYLDLTGNQTLSGSKNFTTAPSFGTPLEVSSGGTGSTSVLPNAVFAGPSGAPAAAPGFRALAASDIPELDASKIVSGTLGVSNGGIGATATAANLIFAGPSIGASSAPGFRSLVSADIPTSLGDRTFGTVTATTVTGNGSGLTALNASSISSGTIGGTYLPANLGDRSFGALTAASVSATALSGNGAALTSLNASNISSGTVGASFLPTSLGDRTFGAVTASSYSGDGSGLSNITAKRAFDDTTTTCGPNGANAGIFRWNGSHFQGCTGTFWATLDNIPPPSVNSISPATGSTAGGTNITILGSNFQALATVTVGTNAATNVVVESTTRLTARTPSSTTAGAKDVVVANPDFQSTTSQNAFTYVFPPSVSSLTPSSGATRGNISVTIAGNYFSGSTVTVGGNAATVTNSSATSLTITLPASSSAGAATVAVTNTYGQGTGSFTYQASGESSSLAASSCAAILTTPGASTGSGLYYLNFGGTGTRTYCDMTNEGGGWTLVWSNVRGGTGKVMKNMTWNTAVNTAPVTSNGTLSTNLEGFILFTGLKYWTQLAPGGLLRYDWARDYGVALDQRYRCSFSLDSGNYYAISMSGGTQLIGSQTPGLYASHNGSRFTTYDADHDTYGTNCSALYSNTPWWYNACWSGNFNGGGEDAGTGYRNGAYWVGSSDVWGTSDGNGGGNGWIFVK